MLRNHFFFVCRGRRMVHFHFLASVGLAPGAGLGEMLAGGGGPSAGPPGAFGRLRGPFRAAPGPTYKMIDIGPGKNPADCPKRKWPSWALQAQPQNNYVKPFALLLACFEYVASAAQRHFS